jgi:hypothetical protein
VGLAGELRSPLNGDAAWLLHVGTQVLHGARPYADILEINPPLAIWLSAGSAALSQAFRLDPAAGYRLVVLAVIGGSTIASAGILRARFGDAPVRRAGLLLAQWLVLLALPAGYFGEREHLALALTLPYLFAVDARVHGLPLPGSKERLAGIAGAIGLAIKPHFLLVWLAIMAYEWSRSPRRAIPFHRLNVAIATALLVYAAAAILLAPDYLPLVRRLGPAYQEFSSRPWLEILTRDTLPVSVLLALAIAIGFRGSVQGGASLGLFATATAGFLLAVLLQGKGFGYHYLLPVGTSVVMLAYLLLLPSGSAPLSRAAGVVLGGLCLALCLWPFLGATLRRAGGGLSPIDRWTLEAAAYLRAQARGQPVGVLSARLADAFPLTLYAGTEWPLRFPHLWFVPVLEGRARGTGAGPQPADRELAAWATRVIAEDLVHRRPVLLLVRELRPDAPADLRNDYVRFLSEDPLFAAEFAKYQRVGTIGELTVFRRRGG